MATHADLSTPLKLFYSYAHEDESFRDEMSKALKLLERQGLFEELYDRNIVGGMDWNREISQRLEAADIIALLVSPDFIASDYCYGKEMIRALERNRDGEAVVVPITVRPTELTDAPFANLQYLPKGGWPISSSTDRDSAYKDIAVGIRTIVSRIRYSRAEQLQRIDAQGEAREDRALDGVVAHEIPLNESREVSVQVRLAASEGLRLALDEDIKRGEENRSYSALPNHVRSSQQFSLPWTQEELRRGDIDLTVRVSPADIVVGPTEKQIKVAAIRDSGVFTFLVSSSREGTYHLNIELLCREVSLAERILRTKVRTHDLPPSSAAVPIASVPLKVRVASKAAHA